MYPKTILTVLVSCILVPGTFAEEKIEVKEIKVEGLTGIPKGKVKEPTVITSNEELAMEFGEEKIRESIQKEVDFKKQQLLVFKWSGSGGDKLTPKEITDDTKYRMGFEFTPGLTRDLRGHFRLYALPKDTKWKVITKDRQPR